VIYVRVKLYGTLRRLSQPETPGLWVGEVPGGITVAGLLQWLGTRVEEAAAVLRNNVPCSLDTVLADGDEIVLVTPVGGG